MNSVLPSFPDSTDKPWPEDVPLEAAPSAGTSPESSGTSSPVVRRQQAVVAMGRRAVALPDLSIVLHDAALILAEMLDLEHCGMAELTDGGQRLTLRLTLNARTPEARTIEQEMPWPGQGSLAGYAIQAARPVAVPNLNLELQLTSPMLRKQGIISAIAVPLSVHEGAFGALMAAGSAPRPFPDEDILFAESVAHLVSTTIARSRAEESLADERRLAAQVLQTVDALVLLLDPQGRIVRINKAGERLTGFAAAEVTQRAITSVFPVQGETELYDQIFKQIQQGVSPLHYESYLVTKEGQRRRIAWSYSGVCRPDGQLDSILATGVDLTAQRTAEEKLERVEQASQETRRLLQQFLPGVDADEEAAAARQAAAQAISPVIAAGLDRRGRERQPYPYPQLVGPVLGGQLPQRDRLTRVACRDIASGGISFLLPAPPISDLFVIGLGQAPNLTYLLAQVAHVTRVEQKGQKLYLIGCNYTGRAPY